MKDLFNSVKKLVKYFIIMQLSLHSSVQYIPSLGFPNFSFLSSVPAKTDPLTVV